MVSPTVSHTHTHAPRAPLLLVSGPRWVVGLLLLPLLCLVPGRPSPFPYSYFRLRRHLCLPPPTRPPTNNGREQPLLNPVHILEHISIAKPLTIPFLLPLHCAPTLHTARALTPLARCPSLPTRRTRAASCSSSIPLQRLAAPPHAASRRLHPPHQPVNVGRQRRQLLLEQDRGGGAAAVRSTPRCMTTNKVQVRVGRWGTGWKRVAVGVLCVWGRVGVVPSKNA